MATRSRIGVMHGDVVEHVYCHWDGYLSHNGQILLDHYDSVKANQLVSMGDISALRPEIGEKHDFDYFFNKDNYTDEQIKLYEDQWTMFYGRDRGEDGTGWKCSTTFEDFLEWTDGCGGEWYYIMKDGVWYCGNLYSRDGRHYRNLVPLRESIEIEVAEEAA